MDKEINLQDQKKKKIRKKLYKIEEKKIFLDQKKKKVEQYLAKLKNKIMLNQKISSKYHAELEEEKIEQYLTELEKSLDKSKKYYGYDDLD